MNDNQEVVATIMFYRTHSKSCSEHYDDAILVAMNNILRSLQ